MDRRLKIPPCVLEDIGPLGPLPKEGLLKSGIRSGVRLGVEPGIGMLHGRSLNYSKLPQVPKVIFKGKKHLPEQKWLPGEREKVHRVVSPCMV